MNLSVLRHFTTCILVTLIGLTAVLSAQTHVVNPADLQKEVLAATGARQRNMETITGFLSSIPKAQKVLGAAGIDPAQVKTAVSSLNDQELARLAARAETAQADFAAGRMSDRDLLYILLGIAALILIIVAVH
jgi:uncharacterized membrane protein